MISTNILYRLAKIKGDEEGTGFIVDKENLVFLVTANHVVRSIYPGSKLNIVLRHWKGDVAVLQKKQYADVCVLRIDVNNIFSPFECKYTLANLFVGQEMYIAGFPLGWEINKEIGGSYELSPFIKRTTIANFGDGDQLYIDTKVNRGFSGAPLFFNVINENVPRVAGIVTHFCEELEGFSICYDIKLANNAVDDLMRESR